MSNLQPSWTAPGGGGVYSAYYGPSNGYGEVSPGVTAVYLGRQAAPIYAGLNIDPTDHIYEDQGLFAFKPGNVSIAIFANQTLTYDFINQNGTLPVWVYIELNKGITGDIVYQYVPTSNPSGWHTENAVSGTWQAWTGIGEDFYSGNTMGSPMISLADIATANPGKTVSRVYLTEGMGDSYHTASGDTAAWVDTVTIGGVTYDFVVPSLASADITSDNNQIGTLATGATLVTTGVGGTMHTLNVIVDTNGGALTAGSYPFTLTLSSVSQTDLEAYFAAKGWPQNYLTQIESEIAGTAPFFYFTSNGNGGYSLTDGFHTALNLGTTPLVIDDNYPVGTYTYTGSINGQVETVTLTVKKILTVTAVSTSKTFGASNPEFTVLSYDGFVNGDTSASLTTQPICGVSDTHTAVGTYPIICSGAADSNYVFTYVPGTLTVNPAPLAITASSPSMTYGGTTPEITASYSGLENDNSAPATAPTCAVTGTVTNVGTYATTCSGAVDSNYVFTYVPGTLTVNKATLTVTYLYGVISVPYGTTAYSGFPGGGLTGVIGQDQVNLVTTAAVGTFASNDVGIGITVTFSGLTLSGAQARDYSLTQPTALVTITAAPLTVTGITANDKVYDGTTAATLNTGNAALSGTIYGTDAVTLDTSSATGAFASNQVGTGITVTVSGLSLTGVKARDYSLTQPTTTADITAAPLTVTGITAENKVYDSSTTATLSGTPVLSGLISDDAGVTLGGTGSANFASQNVGTNVAVTVSGYTVSGGDVSNYAFTQPTGLTASILPADSPLDLSSAVQSASGARISVGGSPIDLSAVQTVGDQSVTIANMVELNSGQSGTITLANTTLSGVSVAIPDGTTILAPSGWTGTIIPPTTASASAPPSGFSLGSTVIEVGSPDVILLLSQPAIIVLPGTGTVGYKPAGSSTWMQITNFCGGTYASPTPPVFPGECYKTDGVNTKILTYHFTTFGFLNANPVPTTSSPSSVIGTAGATTGLGGGTFLPTVNAHVRSNQTGYMISNFTQANSETVSIGSKPFTVVENFITPTTAGVTINGKSLTLSLNTPVQFLNTTNSTYYAELTDISYLPALQTVTLSVYAQPQIPSMPTIAPVTTTAPTTTIAPVVTTTVAPVTTVAPAAPQGPSANALAAIAATGLAIATAIAVGVAYSRSQAAAKAKKGRR